MRAGGSLGQIQVERAGPARCLGERACRKHSLLCLPALCVSQAYFYTVFLVTFHHSQNNFPVNALP